MQGTMNGRRRRIVIDAYILSFVSPIIDRQLIGIKYLAQVDN
jgi:hypothetical protein